MSNKTPAMVLQEYMVKKGTNPLFETVTSHDGGDTFRYRASGDGHTAMGIGRTKKDAKQHAAKMLLVELMNAGKFVPHNADKVFNADDASAADFGNIAKLKDLCTEYSMPAPAFEVIEEAGPPHAKEFTLQCSVATTVRTATSATKKSAKQLAAGKILEFFQNNAPERIAELAECVPTKVPDDVSKSNELAIANYMKIESIWRPNLGQVIADYHLAFKQMISEEVFNQIKHIICEVKSEDPISTVEAIFKTMRLDYSWSLVPSKPKVKIVSFTVPHANPPICLMRCESDESNAKKGCALDVIDYVITMLK